MSDNEEKITESAPAQSAEPETTAPPTPPKKRRKRWLWLLLLIPVMLVAFLYWATATEKGFAWSLRQIDQVSGGAFSAQQVQGTLWRGFSLKKVRIDIPSSEIELDSFLLAWQSNELWSGRLHINHLALGNVKYTARATQPSPPSPMPQSLSLPLAVQ